MKLDGNIKTSWQGLWPLIRKFSRPYWHLSFYKTLANGRNRLEERRKAKGSAYYERKKAVRRQLLEAQKTAKVDEKTKAQLADYGY